MKVEFLTRLPDDGVTKISRVSKLRATTDEPPIPFWIPFWILQHDESWFTGEVSANRGNRRTSLTSRPMRPVSCVNPILLPLSEHCTETALVAGCGPIAEVQLLPSKIGAKTRYERFGRHGSTLRATAI